MASMMVVSAPTVITCDVMIWLARIFRSPGRLPKGLELQVSRKKHRRLDQGQPTRLARLAASAALGHHFSLYSFSEASALIRATIPAAICMVAPIAQLTEIRIAALAGAVSSSTMLETETKAATEARKVPAALISMTASARVPSP